MSGQLALWLVVVAALGVAGKVLEARAKERRRQARRDRPLDLAASRAFCEDCGARLYLDNRERATSVKRGEQPGATALLCRRCNQARRQHYRTRLDWMGLAVLRWWRVRLYRRADLRQ